MRMRSGRRGLAGKALGIAVALILAACVGDDDTSDGAVERDPSRPVVSPTPIEVVTEAADGWFESACEEDLDVLRRMRRGYYPGRSPDVLWVPREPNQFPNSHSGPWDYLQQVPLVLYGPGFIRSRGEISLDRDVSVADLAPTFAELLDTPFPADRPGRVLEDALLPSSRRSPDLRMILTVVWDGGGWSVLDAWPDAWPHLKRLMEEGTSVVGADVGSSPSVTPAVHANIGTGAFPAQHGIVDIRQADETEGRIGNSWADRSPQHVELPTLADLYRPRTGNRAKIGMFAYRSWHIGMIGHGAFLDGGRKDHAIVVATDGSLVTNEDFYSIPGYLHNVPGLEEDVHATDIEDGRRDEKWMGNDVLSDPSDQRHTPAWARYQTRILEALFDREGYGRDDTADLFYVNYKQIDQVGHRWGMLQPEMREVLARTDEELEKLTRYLDREVGERRWVMAVTADHGPAPDLRAAEGWPVRMRVIKDALAEHFGAEFEDLFRRERATGLYVKPEALEERGITTGDVADFVINHRLEDNVPDGDEVPEEFAERAREPVFSSAFPGDELDRIWECATGRAD